MDYEIINQKILELFINCDIRSFPIDCEYIITTLGYNLYKYSELSEEKRSSCIMVSDESLLLNNNIYYNDNMTRPRTRFSIAHEIGHIILGHGEYLNPVKETEANYFASNLLAPRMSIHYAGCKNQNDVVKIFQISQEAAQYAFDDYRRWHHRTVTHKMTVFDKAMYSQFYDKDQNCFVYSVKKCAYCDAEIHNSQNTICKKCNAPIRSYKQYQTEDMLIAESQWLYGGL